MNHYTNINYIYICVLYMSYIYVEHSLVQNICSFKKFNCICQVIFALDYPFSGASCLQVFCQLIINSSVFK